jgi:predicted glutamine amidotransferase
MCIAILKTKKGIITDNELRNSFNSNPDGAGIAYTVNKKLIIEKGIFDVNEFIIKVRNAENICDNNMLIHCRIGTSGIKDERNTHPFYVNDNVCLIHNGVLDIEVPKGSDINDTQIFIKKFMKDIKANDLMHNKCVQELIAKTIDTRNKFVLLDNKGYYKIINEKAGHWKNDVWFSNSSYEDWGFKRTYITSKPYTSWIDSWYDDEDDFIEPEDAIYEEVLDYLYKITKDELISLGECPVFDRKTKLLYPLEEVELDMANEKELEYLPKWVMDEYTWLRDEALGYVA